MDQAIRNLAQCGGMFPSTGAVGMAFHRAGLIYTHGQARFDRCQRLAKFTPFSTEAWLTVSDSGLDRAEIHYLPRSDSNKP